MLIVPGFQTKELLHEGTHSTVYRGQRQTDDQPVILKVLRKDYPTPEELGRFRREYGVARKLDGAGAVKALALEKMGHSLAIIFEDFGGDSLARLMDSGRPALPEFLQLALGITDCVGQIHQNNMMHKDINPNNIVWNSDTGQIKLIDFGITAVLVSETVAAPIPNVLEGTLAYISPEQTGRMNRILDYRTDLYSLGITFYKLLTGRLPFETDDAMELVHAHLAKAPIPPNRLDAGIPGVLSAMVLKLMAKNAEDRYQSALSLKTDLNKCLNQLQLYGQIENFEISQRDVGDRLRIPQKLFGRKSAIETMQTAFDSVSRGTTEIMLVTGDEGIGKTALVNEIQMAVVEKRGLFLFCQFNRMRDRAPYAALIQALQELIKQILTASETQIKVWQKSFLKAVGPNGQLIIDVIPEVELIIGRQPAVPQLPSEETKNRFEHVFKNFIGTFAAKDHPLVLCLDGWQWADTATPALIELLIKAQTPYTFFIGTYRPAEVNASHPLTQILAEVGNYIPLVNTIELGPLEPHHVNQLIAETLACDPATSHALAELCHAKTKGNPFFLNQFIQSLDSDGLLFFDAEDFAWKWDLSRIRQAAITDNVVELMVGKIQKLSPPTQKILRLAACIGSRFDLRTLSAIADHASVDTVSHLWEAQQTGLIDTNFELWVAGEDQEIDPDSLQSENPIFNFLHDRVRQAAYAMLDESERSFVHHRLGRLLLENIPPELHDKRIFELVRQLNNGAGLIENRAEKHELAQLNLRAGQKARAAAAFGAALEYFQIGLAQLTDDTWQSHYDLALDLHQEAAEAAFIVTQSEEMERLAGIVLKRARNVLDLERVYTAKIRAAIARGRITESVTIGLEILERLGVKIPPQPNKFDAVRSILRAKLVLARRQPDDLLELPEMTNPYLLAALRILNHLHFPMFMTSPEMAGLEISTRVYLSVKNGLAPGTPFTFVDWGMLLCGALGDIETGYRFGQLGLKMQKQIGAKEIEARVLSISALHIRHFKEPLRDLLPVVWQAYQRAMEVGDGEFAGLSLYCHAYFQNQTADNLDPVVRSLQDSNETLVRLKQNLPLRANQICLQAFLNLTQAVPDPTRLTGEACDEEKMLSLIIDENDKLNLGIMYSVKAWLFLLFEDYQQAVKYCDRMQKYIHYMGNVWQLPLYYIVDSIARLNLAPNAGYLRRKRLLKKAAANQKKMKKWARHAPMNFKSKFCLVEAERMRVLGKNEKALDLYEQAITLAREQGFVQEEALAYELAARFFLTRENKDVAGLYMTKAHYAYSQWGAQSKVEDLEHRYPRLLAAAAKSDSSDPQTLHATVTATTGTTRYGEGLDLASILKASQAITSEMDLARLIETLMKNVIENAGAQKGFLILNENERLMLKACVFIDPAESVQCDTIALDDSQDLAASIVHYTARTQEPVVLDDAVQNSRFKLDRFIQANRPKSILCLPIILQNELTGLIYLENNQVAAAFTPDRVKLLQVLASQAAVSIENARFYAQVKASEEKYRALHDNAIEGIFQSTPAGKFVTANPAMARILGYDSPQDLMTSVSNIIEQCYADPDDRKRYQKALLENGQVEGLQIQGRRKDGSIFWGAITARLAVDIGGQPLFYEGSLVDITTRKEKERAEIEREAADLASQAKSDFLANMSHEIRTPMNAVIGLAHLALQTELTPKQQDYLSKIHSSANTLLGIINDILDFSKIEAGKLDMESIDFKLDDVLGNLSTVVGRNVEEKGLELIFATQSAPRNLVGDPLRLGQILNNLVNNAVKFTPAGEIVVAIQTEEQTGDRVKLKFSIRDTGIGMTKEQAAMLFQPFTQADESTTRKYGGTGLGLSICKRLVELMDGEIGVESRPAEGSNFYFSAWFGCRADVQPHPVREIPKPKGLRALIQDITSDSEPSLRGARILLVEDNEINQQVVTELLEGAGIWVTLANNGSEAVAKINQGRGLASFEAVLMDLQMPEMDGYEATRQIRESNFKSLPIIGLSAHAMAQERQRCLENGMNDYVTKPIHPDTLFAALNRWVKLPEDAIAYTPPTDAPDAQISLPDLPGFDVESSLARVAGNTALYLDLLKRFYEGQAQAADNIEQALANNDHPLAERLAHTVKGVSGNIGATDLHNLSQTLETAVKDGDAEQTQLALGTFGRELQRVIEQLGAVLAVKVPAAAEPHARRPLDNQRLQPLLDRLYELLAADDGEAVDYLDEIRHDLAAAVDGSTFARLKGQIDQFAFDEALVIVKQIAADITLS